MALNLVACQQVNDRCSQVPMHFRQFNFKILPFGIKGWLNAPFSIEHFLGDKRSLYDFSRLAANMFLLAVHNLHKLGNRGNRYLAKGDAAFFFILSLERPRKVLIALIRHDVELVHRLIENTLAVLVNRQTQTTSNLLTLFHGASGLVQSAYLKDVRIIPPLTQRGMRENEAQRLVDGK